MVWLPPSYESSDVTYPVIYVLDAPMTFAFAAQGALITIFDEAMPASRWIGFGLVWFALVVFTIEALNHRRQQLRLVAHASAV